MDRLAPTDAWFLYLEGPTVPLHVTGLLLLDPSTAPDGLSFEGLRRYVTGRLDLMPELRRRLVEVPLAIDHPSWIDDPDFDLDLHLRTDVLEGSGSMKDLADFVGTFAAARLDRSRPLWEFVLIEGLEGGRSALVMKMHHCIVDGVSGMDFLVHLLDIDPAPAPEPAVAERERQRVPSALEAFADATWNRLASPLRPVRAAADASTALLRTAETTIRRRLTGEVAVAHPINAPRTRFNSSVSEHRVAAFGFAPLDDLKVVRKAFGVTVNDVVLASCTFGLRAYLDAHEGIPDRPLVCSVPVSTHRRDGGGGPPNQVSNMFVNLPVHVADPVEQLMLIHEGCVGAKEIHHALGPDMIHDVVELIPASMFHAATRIYSEGRLADRIAPVHNLIVSNVVGAPFPTYLAGAEVVGMVPFGPLLEGTGLNITVLSNNGDMNFGLLGCPELVPDIDGLLEGMLAGVAALLDAARVGGP